MTASGMAAWAQAHALAAGCAVAVVALAAWLARRLPLARLLRGVSIPVVLGWEAQGLYRLAIRVHVPRDMAWVAAGVSTALLLTFAAYADEHYRKHQALGPNGRRMWYVAVPMGLVVALNSRSPAEFALRLVLPLLSVMAFQARYLPDEPSGQQARRGSFRWTPRRIAVAAGLIDPGDGDLVTVHAERVIRLLTAHALGYHDGPRWLRGWHRRRFDRVMRLASDAHLAAARERMARVRDGIDAITRPAPPPTAPVPAAVPPVVTAQHAPRPAATRAAAPRQPRPAGDGAATAARIIAARAEARRKLGREPTHREVAAELDDGTHPRTVQRYKDPDLARAS